MIIHVQVKPNSHKTSVNFVRMGQYRVEVVEVPSQNKANIAVVRALAKYFHLPKSCLTIIRGHRTKTKTIEVDTSEKLL